MTKTIKAGTSQAAVKAFLKAGNTVLITFPGEKNVADIINMCTGVDVIEYYEGEELKESVQGYTEIDCVSKLSDGYRVELKKAHTLTGRVAELEAENAALQEQITELQLALVELYEGGIA